MEFRAVTDRVLWSKSQGFESNVKNSTIQSNVERRVTYGYESQRAGSPAEVCPMLWRIPKRKLVTWILLGQLAQQLLREGVLFFTACGKGKHNFGERLEVEAVLCSLGELLHTEFLVPVNSTKPECEA